MKLKNISLPQLIIEFVSVVFAVLLALGLNAYKQSLDIEKEAKTLKSAILRECSLNLSKIDSVLLKNENYKIYLDSVVQLPEDAFEFYFSYEFELLTQGAWQIAQNHNAINTLEPGFVLSVSDVYDAQNFYLDYSSFVFKSVGEQLFQKNTLKKTDMTLAMYYNISVMNSYAKSLQTSYMDLLREYENEE